MNISSPFVRRPVATTLLTVAIALAGAVAFRILPVSPLPQVDFPTISVSASFCAMMVDAASYICPLLRVSEVRAIMKIGESAGFTFR